MFQLVIIAVMDAPLPLALITAAKEPPAPVIKRIVPSTARDSVKDLLVFSLPMTPQEMIMATIAPAKRAITLLDMNCTNAGVTSAKAL